MIRSAAFSCLALCALGTRGAAAEVDPLFADHMVVQRDAAIRIRGVADAGETVRVSFAPAGADAAPFEATVADGVWTCDFPARAASDKPYEFRIVSKSGTRVISDVLIGDIWVCAGQSNMEFPVAREAHAKGVLAGPFDPSVRILHHAFAGQYVFAAALKPEVVARLTPGGFYEGGWKTDSAETAAPTSAIGYLFARLIRKESGVPVGIIDYAVGGAPLETFIAADTLTRRFPAKMKGDWTKNAALDTWSRSRALQHLGPNLASAPSDAFGPAHAYKPGFAWSAGPAKLAGFPVAGVLWYQGETNAIGEARVAEYPALFAALVADWRERWRNPGMPFYFAQLSSCDAPHADRALWPEFRDGQRAAYLSLNSGDGSLFGVRESERRNPAEPRGPVGMVVTSDVGDAGDVHPKDKLTVAQRFARWALRDLYGKTKTVVSGPVATSATVSGSAVTVRFESGHGLKPASGSKLQEFEIAGADGKFVEADAKIEGETVVLSARKVRSPREVRYAWKPATRGNLVNAEGLPASTFLLKTK